MNKRRNSRRNAEFSKDSYSTNLVSTINNGIRQDKIVTIQYYSREKGVSQRDIEPMDIIIRNGKKNLVGWCHLRNDWRTFRLDRIIQVVLNLDKHFDPRDNYNRADFEDSGVRHNDSLSKDLPYNAENVKTMSENKLNFSDNQVKEYSDDEEDLTL